MDGSDGWHFGEVDISINGVPQLTIPNLRGWWDDSMEDELCLPDVTPLTTGKNQWSDYNNGNLKGWSLTKLCPNGLIVESMEFKEQRGYGLVDLHIDCGDGVNRVLVGNSGGGANVRVSCDTGFKSVEGREQWGYGLVNTHMKCNGAATGTDSNPNQGGWWNPYQSCPDGYAISGFDVREQTGHGLINFRFLCSELL